MRGSYRQVNPKGSDFSGQSTTHLETVNLHVKKQAILISLIFWTTFIFKYYIINSLVLFLFTKLEANLMCLIMLIWSCMSVRIRRSFTINNCVCFGKMVSDWLSRGDIPLYRGLDEGLIVKKDCSLSNCACDVLLREGITFSWQCAPRDQFKRQRTSERRLLKSPNHS